MNPNFCARHPKRVKRAYDVCLRSVKIQNVTIDYQFRQALEIVFQLLNKPDFRTVIPSSPSAKDAVAWLCPSDRMPGSHVDVNSAVRAGEPCDTLGWKRVLANRQAMRISFLDLLEFRHLQGRS
jgi:hypothetical protein